MIIIRLCEAVSAKAKAGKTFKPVKPTNPSVKMAYKGQSSFGIIAILYI